MESPTNSSKHGEKKKQSQDKNNINIKFNIKYEVIGNNYNINTQNSNVYSNNESSKDKALSIKEKISNKVILTIYNIYYCIRV